MLRPVGIGNLNEMHQIKKQTEVASLS